ncbi:non-ribosomal peptide synthetase [Streptomyces arenae]|uniref:non-ribosomal peptide synthetase n=1 Tax=Streptomyces arenae TaxID=29301 RepID=UPI00265929D8|nr:non-ribosomal peptide synthetase [Streptomyces arenae]MCG7204958.1 amino acid adenylation domain-containing protein [Streptomyces arenae]
MPATVAALARTVDPPVGATAEQVVVAAGFLALLGRYTRRADQVVGWCTWDGPGGRPGHRLLRVPSPSDVAFTAYLGAVRTALADACRRPALPEEPHPSDLDDTLLRIGIGPAPQGGIGSTMPYDMVLEIGGPSGESPTVLRYRKGLLDRATTARLADQLGGLLESAAANPACRIAELPVITDLELETVTMSLARGGDLPPEDTTVAELFRQQAAADPGAVAVECGNHRMTYAELDARSTEMATRLTRLGIGPGSLCALLLDRSAERIVALLGILKSGAGYVPLDAEHPAQRLATVLQDCRAAVVLTREGLRERLPAGGVPVVAVDDGTVPVPGPTPRRARPGDLAYVTYTSGSTGRPKGVMVENRAVVAFLAGIRDRLDLGPGVRMLQFAGITFDATVCEIFGPLVNGGTVVVPPPDTDTVGPGLLDFLRSARVTTAMLPPSLLSVLSDEYPLPALHTLLVGGEVVSSAVFARWGRRRRFLVGYGPTETTLIACTGDRLLDDRPPAIGRPLPGVEMYVLDEAMSPVAAGITGEIWIGGGNLARGYLGAPALTADAFRPHPISDRPGARLYRTGDLGRWLPSGELEFLGRADGQLKIRGQRVELGEVEQTLAALPGVRDCAVVPHGNGADLRLVAFAAGTDLDPTALARALASRLPRVMLPALVVPVDKLPIASHGGKADRGRLRELAATALVGATSAEPPADPAERRMAELWADALGLPAVGRDDGFLALGGTSLQAARVLARLRDEDGRRIGFADFLAAGTLAEATALLTNGTGHAAVLPALDTVTGQDDIASPGQQRLWFLSTLGGRAAAAYNVPVATRLVGRLDPEALRSALAEVVSRHEALRTGFVLRDGELRMVTNEAAEVPFVLQDASGEPDPFQAALRLAEAHAGAGFDLADAPLVRAALIRLADDEHLLVLVLSHLVTDNWSVDLLDRELATAYSGSPLRSRPLEQGPDYRDFAAWQRSLASSGSRADDERYWREELSGAPGHIPLPYDRPGPDAPTFAGRRASRTLPGLLARRITQLARTEGTTPYAVFLVALAVLIDRVTGRDDMVIGSPTAGRPGPRMDDVMGFFVNTVPLRLRTAGASPRTLLRAAARTALDAFEHQHVPFDWLAREFGGATGAPASSLIQVVLAYQGPRRPYARLGNLRCEPLPVDNGTAKFDLTFEVEEVAGDLVCTAEYNTDLFDTETGERLLDWYIRSVEAVVDAPDTTVSGLRLFTDAELSLAVTPPSRRAGPGRLLHTWFSQQAARFADRIAVTDGETNLTYGELDRAANRLAHRLLRHGAGPGRLVGVCAERAAGTVVALLAVLKTGAGYLPLDPAHPTARTRSVLADADCNLVVGADRHRETAGDVFWLTPDAADLAAEPDTDPAVRVQAEDIAYVIYTSGSTGRPKGVMVAHDNVTRLFENTHDAFRPGPDDVWTAFHSFAFDFSVWEMWGALLHGGRLVVVPYSVSRDPEAVLDLLLREKVTVLNQTPSAFRGLIRAADRVDWPDTALRLIVFGGEELEPAMLRPWFERYGDTSPSLVNMYGITETTVHVTLRPLRAADAASPVSPIGPPLPGVGIAVLDKAMRPVPVGTVGEMYVNGAGVSHGYLGRAALTAERFLPDPFGGPGRTLYRTGDLAVLRPDGELVYRGRIDDQVQLRGFRIELGEVEAALLAHEGVRETAVVVGDDHEGEQRLVAYVVTDSGPLSADRLRAALADRLPAYMVPASFVPLERLPLTVNGKLDRAALPVQVVQRERTDQAPVTVPPRIPAEHRIAEAWCTALDVPQVSVHDNFFALGGDSITAIRVVARVRDAGLAITVEELYRHPSVAELAVLCGDRDRQPAAGHKQETPVSPPPTDIDAYHVSSMQLGIIYECEVSDDPTLYHTLTSVRLVGPLDLAALRRALDRISDRHEMLRTSFDLDAFPDPLQVVHGSASMPLSHLVAPDGVDPGTALREWWAGEWKRPFDLAEAPLARCHVLTYADGTFSIALSMHHAVEDGWSMAVIVGDLLLAYESELGTGAVLEPLPRTRFRDFVALERRSVDEPETAGFWRKRIVGARRRTMFPPDRGTGGDPGVDPEVCVPVPAELVGGAREVAGLLGLPAKSVFLTAHLWTLRLLTGSEDVATGIVGNGRTETEGSERVAGLFLNSLPLYLTLNEGSWQASVAAVFDAERQMLPHRRYPVARMRAEADGPLFDVMFNYADFHDFDRLGALRMVRPLDWWFSARTAFALDVELAARPQSDAFDLFVRVNPRHLEPVVAERASDAFLTTLAAIVRDPGAPAGGRP